MHDDTLHNASTSRAAARLVGALCLSAASLAAQALPVTTLADATPVAIPSVDLVSDGLDTLAPGVTYVSSFMNSVFGFTGAYSFGANGNWSGTPMIGLRNPNGSFEVRFADPVSGFLADINWTIGAHNGNASMTAYDAAGIELESLAFEKKVGSVYVNKLAPGLHGFQRPTEDIAFVRFSNESIGIRNLSVTGLDAGRQSVSTQSVPEPGTLALASLAVVGMAGTALRRRAKARR